MTILNDYLYYSNTRIYYNILRMLANIYTRYFRVHIPSMYLN